ncbi:hypothetical protein SELMODRAFT_404181 [Selaginella moellendorffii]|uniref:Uncharacterized protein n=1 Tax=Selaginella moellendorffii TaxID=88036 RepID=D8QUI4_SELML|nr:hypothetical protein SELMODRAFT_404181 [Selaginella moellendorffii]
MAIDLSKAWMLTTLKILDDVDEKQKESTWSVVLQENNCFRHRHKRHEPVVAPKPGQKKSLPRLSLINTSDPNAVSRQLECGLHPKSIPNLIGSLPRLLTIPNPSNPHPANNQPNL